MKIEGVWWSWDTRSSCANRRQEESINSWDITVCWQNHSYSSWRESSEPVTYTRFAAWSMEILCFPSSLFSSFLRLSYFSALFSSYCHVFQLIETGCGLVIGFTDYLQNVTTSNYRAIANSYALQFTTARTKPSQSALPSPAVVWQRLPTVDANFTFGFRTASMPQLPASNSSNSQEQNRNSLLTNPPINTFHSTLLNCTAITNSTRSVEWYGLGVEP
jgi:hypothetical protein